MVEWTISDYYVGFKQTFCFSAEKEAMTKNFRVIMMARFTTGVNELKTY
jgi:hypothetical protein